MYRPVLIGWVGPLPDFGRGGDALDRGDPEADARGRPPDFGTLLLVTTGVAGGEGVVGGVREVLRRFGVTPPSVGVSGSDSSVTDSCEDMGDRARFSEASLWGVCSREVAWRDVSAMGDSDRLGEGEGDWIDGGGERVALTFGRC